MRAEDPDPTAGTAKAAARPETVAGLIPEEPCLMIRQLRAFALIPIPRNMRRPEPEARQSVLEERD